MHNIQPRVKTKQHKTNQALEITMFAGNKHFSDEH